LSPRTAWIVTVLALALTASAKARPPSGKTGALQAMLKPSPLIQKYLKAELDRNMAKLRIANEAKPYYMALSVADRRVWWVSAKLGALLSRARSRYRSLQALLRVGDMQLDNTSYYSFYPRAQHERLPYEDNGLAIRRAAYFALDKAYKYALRALSKKKAYLQSHPQQDRPDDWVKAETQNKEKIGRLITIAPQKWEPVIKRVSGVFRRYPRILDSAAVLSCLHTAEQKIDSEQTHHFESGGMLSFKIYARTQTEDGMRLYLSWKKQVLPGAKMPDEKKLLATAQKLAKDLVALAQAPKVKENYSGPVLFEGQAAAQFMLATIGAHTAANARPVTWSHSRGVFEDMIGRAVLPRWVTVIDNPKLKRYKGKKLAGSYSIDDEGIAAQKVTVVDRGKLKAFLSCRKPAKDAKKSNGHGRGLFGGLSTMAAPSNLIIRARRRLSRRALKRKFLGLLKRKGLDHGYIVRKTQPFRAYSLFGTTSRNLRIPQPLMLYKVDRKGRETLVRGAKFDTLPASELERLPAMGGPIKVTNIYIKTSLGVSVITPNLIVDRIEISEQSKRRTRNPLLPSPLSFLIPKAKGSK
jgi:hypothetical protein